MPDSSSTALDDLYAALVHGDGVAEPRQLSRLLAQISASQRGAPICRFADAVITRTGDLGAADIAHRSAAKALSDDPLALCAVLCSWLGIALNRQDLTLVGELRQRAAELHTLGHAGVAASLVSTIDALALFAVGRSAAAESALVDVLGGNVPGHLRGVIAIVRALALQSMGLLDASTAVLDAEGRNMGSFDLAADLTRARATWANGEHARARSMLTHIHAEARARGRQHDGDFAAALERVMARHDGLPPELPPGLPSTPPITALCRLDEALALLPDRTAARLHLIAHPEVCAVAPEFFSVPYALCPEYRDRLCAAAGPGDPFGSIASAHRMLAADTGQHYQGHEQWQYRNMFRPWVLQTAALGAPTVTVAHAAHAVAGGHTASACPVDDGEVVARASVRVLGATRVMLDNEPVVVTRSRVRSLLASLALQRRMTRERLIDVLWPDMGPPAGANNLRTTLTYARQLVSGVELIRSEGPFIVLAVETDLALVHREAESARRAESAGRTVDAADHWRLAADGIGGRFGDDVSGESWLDAARYSIDAMSVDVLLRAAEAHFDGDPAASRRWADIALQIDPWSERAMTAIASSWAAEGDAAATRLALRRAETLLDELGVDPGHQLADLLVRFG